MSVQYAVKDRDGKITEEAGKKAAKRDQKAFGGMIVRSKGEGDFKPLEAAPCLPVVLPGPLGRIHPLARYFRVCRGPPDHPPRRANLTSGECKGASEAGTGLAIGFEILIWVVVDFLVGLTYGIYQLVER